MAAASPVLAVDFGTSNSAAGILEQGRPRLIPLGDGETTLPTTFFFDFDTRETLMGAAANRALLNGADGRFMRALKRVLGTNLMHEPRQILNERTTFVDIIARFLRQIKDRAEAETGTCFTRALSGRPVFFHGADDPREPQAEADLRAAYLAAGFEAVDFLCEPEAAALACGADRSPGEIGLIVDIGGGTSDFSLFQATQDGISILANHGLRIGGTDFDKALSVARVMPLLGKGTQLRKILGPGRGPVPNALFSELATWELIPFTYTAQNRRQVAEMLRLAEAPEKIARLATVLEHELGHDLAFAVERGKIAANSENGRAAIDLGEIEPGLVAPLTAADLMQDLMSFSDQLGHTAHATLRRADIAGEKIGRVIYVGGSSLMAFVADRMRREFPGATHEFSEVFTAVADGLAIASARR